MKEAQKLIDKGRYHEAGKLLDNMLSSDQENSELWYLRGLVSLKMKNYDGAKEYLGRAIDIKRRAKYFRTKGMAHLEIFEIEEAIEAFEDTLELEDDATTNFFIAICYMFKDDPQAGNYMKRARKIDSKKTNQLIKNFYTIFLKHDPAVSETKKKRLEEDISRLNKS